MTSRRKFLSNLAIGTAAIALSHPLTGCSTIGKRKLKDFGYISGIIGKELRGDWKDILRQTAEMGYTEIETGRYFGDSATGFLEYCSEIGLKPVAGGTRLFQDMDELKNSLDKLKELDLKYAVIYWPWLVSAPFSLEDCKKSVELLNKIGEVCDEKDIQLCWHNHDNEFREMEEGYPFDYLMNNTDPELVKCEMDVYWVKKGGANPVEMLKKYEGRYTILHIKDMAAGPEEDFACVGDGIVDFPSIFAEAFNQDIEHFFVERDNVEDGMACLTSAADYLKSLRF